MTYLVLLSFIFSPLYIFKKNLFGIPANFLMLWVLFVWLVFFFYLIKNKAVQNFLDFIKKIQKENFFLIGLFILASIISLFTKQISSEKIGWLLVIFIQPISLFFIAKYLKKKDDWSKKFITATYWLVGLSGIYAAVQYFTLFGLPVLFQGNDVETKRAISFFTHPNFYSLFVAPLLAFLIPDLMSSLRKNLPSKNFKILAWTFGTLGLILSLSRAGWLGLLCAFIFYAVLTGDKKIKQTALITLSIAAIIAVTVPDIRTKLIKPFLGEKSSSSRLTLWESGIKVIKSSPVLGLGLKGYEAEYKNLISDPSLPAHNFPHNIFLNFWVETGMLGLVSFFLLLLFSFYKALAQRSLVGLSVAMFLICFLVQGQIDNPYFKNDLAIVFWLVLSLL